MTGKGPSKKIIIDLTSITVFKNCKQTSDKQPKFKKMNNTKRCSYTSKNCKTHYRVEG